MWWTLRLWLTIGLSPFLPVVVARLAEHPLRVPHEFLVLGSAIPVLLCMLGMVPCREVVAMLPPLRTLVDRPGPSVVTLTSRRLAEMHLLFTRRTLPLVRVTVVASRWSVRGREASELDVSGSVIKVPCMVVLTVRGLLFVVLTRECIMLPLRCSNVLTMRRALIRVPFVVDVSRTVLLMVLRVTAANPRLTLHLLTLRVSTLPL